MLLRLLPLLSLLFLTKVSLVQQVRNTKPDIALSRVPSQSHIRPAFSFHPHRMKRKQMRGTSGLAATGCGHCFNRTGHGADCRITRPMTRRSGRSCSFGDKVMTGDHNQILGRG